MTIAGGIAAALFRRQKQRHRVGGRRVAPRLLGCGRCSPTSWPSQLFGPTCRCRPPSTAHADPPTRSSACYQTKDGRFVNLVLPPVRPLLARLLPAASVDPSCIDDPRFADAERARAEQGRSASASLDDAVRASARSTEWRDMLDASKGCGRRCRTSPRSAHDRQVDRERLRPRGRPRTTGTSFSAGARTPVQFDETPPELTPAPELGQHTEEVLLELGLTWDEITAHKSAATSSERTCVAAGLYDVC